MLKNHVFTSRGPALLAAAVIAALLLTACTGDKSTGASSVSSEDSSTESSASSTVLSEASSAADSAQSSSAAATSAVSADSSAASTESSSAVSHASSAASSTASSAAYTVYTNARYGFSVSVPSALKELSASETGRTYTSADDLVILSVEGSNNTQHVRAATYFQQNFYDMQAGIVSKKESGGTAVIQWKADGKIGYIKAVVGKGSVNILRFQFPAEKKVAYTATAQYLLAHFQTPGVGSTH